MRSYLEDKHLYKVNSKGSRSMLRDLIPIYLLLLWTSILPFIERIFWSSRLVEDTLKFEGKIIEVM